MSENRENIVIFILAAGNSSRMGSVKQLLSWENSTLIETAIQSALHSSAKKVILILGANQKKIKSHLTNKFNIDIVDNQKWKEGMSGSIKCGIIYLESCLPNCQGILFCLADQPLIKKDELNMLIDLYRNGEKDIVATSYKGKPGVPSIFHPRFKVDLLSLEGDHGAGKILKNNLSEIKLLDLNNKIVDIDTPEEYEKLYNKHHPKT